MACCKLLFILSLVLTVSTASVSATYTPIGSPITSSAIATFYGPGDGESVVSKKDERRQRDDNLHGF
jgi:hypothetical protein